MELKDPIEVVISFDTTGSMYPCLTQVRRKVEKLVNRLFKDVPDLRIGVITHGDYCDAPDTITKLDLTDNQRNICEFVRNAPATGGGDFPECYELVLHEARKFNWSAGKNKVLVMIGDATPHGPHYPANTKNLDWRNELGLLLEAGVNVYSVQALNRSCATAFWQECAERTGGFHLQLAQFASVGDLIMGICFRQQGVEQLEKFEQELVSAGRMDRHLDASFAVMTGRKKKRYSAPAASKRTSSGVVRKPVDMGRFQVMEVDHDCTITDFVRSQGLEFKAGSGFYEFTKSVKIQSYKRVIAQDTETGDIFEGDAAREVLGIPLGDARARPTKGSKYRGFVQSTSYNRKLLGGTRFLYEVPDYAMAGVA